MVNAERNTTRLWISETFVDKDKDAIFGESPAHETAYDTPGALYRSLMQEYGRCTGHVYVDMKDGPTRAIGWVFVKRMRYEDDSTKTYLREVWVNVYKSEPKTTSTTTYDYAELGFQGDRS